MFLSSFNNQNIVIQESKIIRSNNTRMQEVKEYFPIIIIKLQ